ncbi:RNA-directed DNA polymerase [Cupriavidus basilensis OR16]|uniref:RNA-directed DNA polymerase n=1 Tax=Cupriavidus basilensis OR16 TaxID=1127483 RepID=H1S8D2_9BURK|nr:retron St85 family RNA-directed DNA polymerase [Cupriavidus basilensis]EHP41252.1 RNA-directed DNA polymerase [Cupriavidus basilensis OR16]
MSLKDRLLRALPFSRQELELLISTAPFRYKEYKIPKRKEGAFRLIAQPTPEVKLVQRWLVKNELSTLPIHSAAKAYKADTGLIENVIPHKNHRFLLKLDFENFFPSITASDFHQFMEDNGFSNTDIPTLINLLFKRDHATKSLRLAIGAPSSPTISNILLYPLDRALDNHCSDLAVSYTRYADDLSFSTNLPGILKDIEQSVPALIKASCSLNLRINKNKTTHTSKKRGRRVTGLVITSENEISVGRFRKRLLRAQIHHFGAGKLPPEETEALRGYLSFLNSVEPDQIDRLRIFYGKELMSRLMSR